MTKTEFKAAELNNLNNQVNTRLGIDNIKLMDDNKKLKRAIENIITASGCPQTVIGAKLDAALDNAQSLL